MQPMVHPQELLTRRTSFLLWDWGERMPSTGLGWAASAHFHERKQCFRELNKAKKIKIFSSVPQGVLESHHCHKECLFPFEQTVRGEQKWATWYHEVQFGVGML